MVDQAKVVTVLIETINEIVPSIRQLKTEYLKLLYNMVWTLGILNSEKNRYAE